MTMKSQWIELVKKWESSGLTQAQFCQSEAINYKDFLKWRKVWLKERLPTTKMVKAAPITQVEDHELGFSPLQLSHQEVDSGRSDEPSMIEINLPYGIIIRIPSHAGSA